ncbi:MAG: biopolymer transporter ExbD [Gammaproteobacteria bacterium]|nr:biopolymer transporter ExbD [Gammaproteobacteria bacterium]
MRFKTRQPEEVELNVTSLIDVVLLLLIFFMVSTRFIDESKINLVLPSASQQPVDKIPDAIEIVIDKKGQFFVNTKALINGKIGTIQQALTEVKQQTRDSMVVISADREAPFQLAVDAMDAARLAGLYRVTFPTTVRKPE